HPRAPADDPTRRRSGRKRKKTGAAKPAEPLADQAPSDEAPPEGDPAPEDEAAGEAEEEARDQGEPPLLPVGNPLRIVRGSVTLVLGALVAFGIMASRPQLRFGVPVGALAILVATFGLLDLIGSFDDPDERVAGRTTLGELGGPLALFFGGLGGMAVFIT